MDIDEKKVLFQTVDEKDSQGDGSTAEDHHEEEPKTVIQGGAMEEPAAAPTGVAGSNGLGERSRVPLYEASDLLIEGIPLIIGGYSPDGNRAGNRPATATGEPRTPKDGNGNYGGNTDLDKLNALGMWVALTFELERLRRSGLTEATAFDVTAPAGEDQVLVFDVSKPELVESARSKSNLFNKAITGLQQFGVVPDWPGFDILTLDTRLPQTIDRMIELKSSGVASRVQEMTWNEWKTANASTLRKRFYLYLVGNLRSDLVAAQPYIRTIRNPFEQIVADVQVTRAIQKKVQLAVHEFQEAEHLDLTLRRPRGSDGL